MRNAITLSDESPSVVFLKNKDKRLARVIDMVGTITYTPYGQVLKRMSYIIDVGSRIGTEGETKVEIIFQGDNADQIVTCYPISDSAANIEMNRQSWTRVGQP